MIFIFALLDSGVTSPPAGGATSPPAGGSTSPPDGSAVSNPPPPNDGIAPASSVSVVAVAFAVAPDGLPYNLSILSNKPVLVITVGVALSSSPTARSILCCCKSNLISSSDQPKICFLAHVDDVG